MAVIADLLAERQARRAALAGLFLPGRGAFGRTPKFAVQNSRQRWEGSEYALARDSWVWMEVALGSLAALSVPLRVAAPRGYLGFVPWLIIYAAGFSYVAAVTLWQSARLSKLRTRSAVHTAEDTPRGARTPSRVS